MSAGHLRQRSPGSWELRYDLPRIDGKRRIATTTFRGSKKQAQARLRELMGHADRGEHVEPNRATLSGHVASRIEAWHASGRISPLTAQNYRDRLRWLIMPHLGSVPIQQLTTIAVESWHGTLRSADLSSSTVHSAHQLLTRALSDAVRHGLLARNVAELQKPPKGSAASEIEIIGKDQIAPMLARLEGDPFRVPVVTALFCGLRRSEQLALRWSDIDLAAKRLRVEQALEETRGNIRIKAPKTAAGKRTISLPDIVVDALRQHRLEQIELRMALGMGKPDYDALVFPGDDGRYMLPRAFSLRWLRTVRRLSLPQVGWHALRHTHASMLINAGVDIVTISRRLGHSKPDITLRVYSHLFRKDDTVAAEAINAAINP
jgi:integrase